MLELTVATSRRAEHLACELQLPTQVPNLHDLIVSQPDDPREVAQRRRDRHSVSPRLATFSQGVPVSAN